MDLVSQVARVVVRTLARLIAPAVLIGLRAPFMLIRAAMSVPAVALRLWSMPRQLRLAVSDTTSCPRCGRRQSLLGRWKCPICKGVETTHAWAPCTICGAKYPAGYILCEDRECGEAIQNPTMGGGL